jgi:hypothetical protein
MAQEFKHMTFRTSLPMSNYLWGFLFWQESFQDFEEAFLYAQIHAYLIVTQQFHCQTIVVLE